MTDWLLRIGDGKNFINSSKYKIWGINSSSPDNKHFLKNVKKNDRLWFIICKSKGKILAVATYESHNFREFGELINLSLTNEELGWTGCGTDWTSDIQMNYTNLYWLDKYNLLTNVKGPKTIRKYNEKCKINLETEYIYIKRYLIDY